MKVDTLLMGEKLIASLSHELRSVPVRREKKGETTHRDGVLKTGLASCEQALRERRKKTWHE